MSATDERRRLDACGCLGTVQRWRIASSALVLVLLATTAASPVYGEENREEAQRHFDEGIRLFNLGQFKQACTKFEEALSFYPDGLGTRGKLAECYEKVGRIASAYAIYQEVVRLAGFRDDRLRGQVAEERIRALKPRLSYLTVKVEPLMAVAEGFTVKRNEILLEPRDYGIRSMVDPGTYTVVATAPGYRRWAIQLQVPEGRAKAVEVPQLVLESKAPESVSSSPEEGGEPSGWNGQRIAAVSLLGLGTASLLATGFFGWQAYDTWNGIDAECRKERRACTPDELDNRDEADSNAWIANGAGAVAAVSITAGILLWRWSSDARARPAAAESAERSLKVVPTASPDGFGVTLSSSF